MDLLPCGEIESTSTHATQLLGQGRVAPFAVWATSQTGGRGRRGRSWESPLGNLYLTIVLPPSALADEYQGTGAYGCLPLKAALLVARVIENRTGLTPTLKWPNDVLLEGRKVGGLLLEMSSAGGKTGEVLIGIGLNLNLAPSLRGAYAATSVAAVVGGAQEVHEWVSDLVAVFEDEWSDLPLESVPQAFGRFGIASGSLWREGAAGPLYQMKRIDGDGSLVLEPLVPGPAAPAERRLASVDHGFTWIYLGDQPSPLLVADVGNTRIKIAAYKSVRERDPVGRTDLPSGAERGSLEKALEDLCRTVGVESGWPLHILSVNPQGASQLAAACAAAHLTPLTITRKPLRRRGTGYQLSVLGMDRLAAIEGYLATTGRTSPERIGRHAVLVSAGTATTIDLVELTGAHLGGLIIPGFRAALRSLRQTTQLLPLLDPEPQGHAGLGSTTEEALQQGVLQMTLGAIERVRSRGAPSGFDSNAEVILTGGQATLLAPHLAAKVVPDLVLEGARQLVQGGA